MPDSIENKWTNIANKMLVGRKIVGTRYLTKAEKESLGWHSRPIVLILDDGTLIFPATDDEGNDGGALFTTNKQDPVIPLIK